MKIFQRVLLALLVIAILGMGITAIVKSHQAINETDQTLKNIDEFIYWVDHH